MSEGAGKGQSIMAPGFQEVLHTGLEEKRKDKRMAARWRLGKSYKEESRELFRKYTGLGDNQFDALRKIDPERLCDFLTRKAIGRVIMKSPFLIAELVTLFAPFILLVMISPPIMTGIVLYIFLQAMWLLAWLFMHGTPDDRNVLVWVTRDVRYLINRLRLPRSEALKVLEEN